MDLIRAKVDPNPKKISIFLPNLVLAIFSSSLVRNFKTQNQFFF